MPNQMSQPRLSLLRLSAVRITPPLLPFPSPFLPSQPYGQLIKASPAPSFTESDPRDGAFHQHRDEQDLADMATLGLLVSEILWDERPTQVTHATFFSMHAEIPREFGLLAQAVEILSCSKADVGVGRYGLRYFDNRPTQRLVSECRYLLDTYISDYRNEVTPGNAAWALRVLDFTYKRRALWLIERIRRDLPGWLSRSLGRFLGCRTLAGSAVASTDLGLVEAAAASAGAIPPTAEGVIRVRLPSKVVELERMPVVRDFAQGKEIIIKDENGRVLFRHQIITDASGACYPYTPYEWNTSHLPAVAFKSEAIKKHVVELQGQTLYEGTESPRYSFSSHQSQKQFQQEIRGKELVHSFNFLAVTSRSSFSARGQNIKIWRDKTTLEFSLSFFSDMQSFASDFEFPFSLLSRASAVKRSRGVDISLIDPVASSRVQQPHDNRSVIELRIQSFRIMFPNIEETSRFWSTWESCWEEHDAQVLGSSASLGQGDREDVSANAAYPSTPSEAEAEAELAASAIVNENSPSPQALFSVGSHTDKTQLPATTSLSWPETSPLTQGPSSPCLHPRSKEIDGPWPSNDSSWVVVVEHNSDPKNPALEE